MASYLTDMDEIRRIIFEAPTSSDDLWQSSSEDSIQFSGSDSESENTQTTRGSEWEVRATVAPQEHQDNGCQLQDNARDPFLHSKINKQSGGQ